MPLRTTRFEGELGCWTTTNWEPVAGDVLAPYVLGIWDFDGVLAQSRERVFPNGALELIVQLDEPHRPGDAVDPRPFPAVCIGGLQTTSEVVQGPPGRCRVLGVRLRPVGAFALTGSALDDLRGITVDLRAAVGRDADDLGTSCHAARDGAERIRIVTAWIARRVSSAKHLDARVAWAAAAIDASVAGCAPAFAATSASARSASRESCASAAHSSWWRTGARWPTLPPVPATTTRPTSAASFGSTPE